MYTCTVLDYLVFLIRYLKNEVLIISCNAITIFVLFKHYLVVNVTLCIFEGIINSF